MSARSRMVIRPRPTAIRPCCWSIFSTRSGRSSARRALGQHLLGDRECPCRGGPGGQQPARAALLDRVQGVARHRLQHLGEQAVGVRVNRLRISGEVRLTAWSRAASSAGPAADLHHRPAEGRQVALADHAPDRALPADGRGLGAAPSRIVTTSVVTVAPQGNRSSRRPARPRTAPRRGGIPTAPDAGAGGRGPRPGARRAEIATRRGGRSMRAAATGDWRRRRPPSKRPTRCLSTIRRSPKKTPRLRPQVEPGLPSRRDRFAEVRSRCLQPFDRPAFC